MFKKSLGLPGVEQIEEKQRENPRIWRGGRCGGPSRVRGRVRAESVVAQMEMVPADGRRRGGGITGLPVGKCRQGAVAVSSWGGAGGISSSHTSTAYYTPSFVLNPFHYPFNRRDKPAG